MLALVLSLFVNVKNVFFFFQERKGAKTVRDIKQFVSKLPHIQAAKQSLATRKSNIMALMFVKYRDITNLESMKYHHQVPDNH